MQGQSIGLGNMSKNALQNIITDDMPRSVQNDGFHYGVYFEKLSRILQKYHKFLLFLHFLRLSLREAHT